jgi:hypothetical protein
VACSSSEGGSARARRCSGAGWHFAGPIFFIRPATIDRFSPRRVMLLVDLLRFMLTPYIAVAIFFDFLEIRMVLISLKLGTVKLKLIVILPVFDLT